MQMEGRGKGLWVNRGSVASCQGGCWGCILHCRRHAGSSGVNRSIFWVHDSVWPHFHLKYLPRYSSGLFLQHPWKAALAGGGGAVIFVRKEENDTHWESLLKHGRKVMAMACRFCMKFRCEVSSRTKTCWRHCSDHLLQGTDCCLARCFNRTTVTTVYFLSIYVCPCSKLQKYKAQGISEILNTTLYLFIYLFDLYPTFLSMLCPKVGYLVTIFVISWAVLYLTTVIAIMSRCGGSSIY